MPKIKGDGTNDLLNKASLALVALSFFGAWQGTIYWAERNDLPTLQVGYGLLLLLAAGFVATVIHELGHAIVGFAFSMRLRAFSAGPFQFAIRDGKWGLHFNPAGLLSSDGQSGMVPSSPNMPTRYQVAVILAGPVTSFYSGALAIAIAVAIALSRTAPGAINREFAYPCALFGLYSIIISILNLIPLRTGENYSDGAKVVQLLSSGPFSDFHRVQALVDSSLITPLRPRDYPLANLQRAAAGIDHGLRGLLLRLWMYEYFVDTGNAHEASQALEQADQLSRDSVPELPVELHPQFVFGHALVRRDAKSARVWWDGWMDKNPTHMNSDYYRAEGALHWIEGNLEAATAAWTRSSELSQQLPAAGLYDFDRTCCAMLRHAIESTPGAVTRISDPVVEAAPIERFKSAPSPESVAEKGVTEAAQALQSVAAQKSAAAEAVGVAVAEPLTSQEATADASVEKAATAVETFTATTKAETAAAAATAIEAEVSRPSPTTEAVAEAVSAVEASSGNEAIRATLATEVTDKHVPEPEVAATPAVEAVVAATAIEAGASKPTPAIETATEAVSAIQATPTLATTEAVATVVATETSEATPAIEATNAEEPVKAESAVVATAEAAIPAVATVAEPLQQGVPVLDESNYKWTFLNDFIAPQPEEPAPLSK